jgi:hypothetical protein
VNWKKAAWKSYKNVTINFSGNQRQKNITIWWLTLYNPTKLRGDLSLKVHFLELHRLLPRKSWGSERRVRTAISPGHFHHRKAVPKQVASQYTN